MTDTYVSETDAFTFSLERDPLLRSTIVSVAVFDRGPDWSTFVDRIERATRLAPTFRQKLVPSPLGLAPPRWVVDPDFDIDWHVRRARVPSRGGMGAVIEFARTTGMAALDHERPLWEFTLLEGLPAGRAALVMKVHHALTDGIGGVDLAAHVVDLTPEAQDLGPLPPAPQPGAEGTVHALADAVGHNLRRMAQVGRELTRAPSTAVDAVRHPVRAARGTVRNTMSVARFVRPVTRTLSPVMTGRRLQWHYETMDVPLDELKAGAAAAGGTLNDAFVAGIAGGFRRYHERHGADVEELRMTMPISVRTADDGIGGNHITLVRFAVPVGIVDAAMRIREVGTACRALRHEPAIAYSQLIAGVLNLLPVAITGGMLKHVDLLTSNVPGFDAPVYVGGALMESFYAFGPTLGSSANVTLMSYRGTCHIGVNTDPAAVPDPEVLLECLREGFDEVLSLDAA